MEINSYLLSSGLDLVSHKPRTRTISAQAIADLCEGRGNIQDFGLEPKELQILRLVVSQIVGCHCCVANHAEVGLESGLNKSEIRAARTGELIGNYRLDAIARFARLVLNSKGNVAIGEYSTVLGAGYSERQISSIGIAIATTAFVNLMHRTEFQ